MSNAAVPAPIMAANSHLFHYCAHKSGMGEDSTEKERQAKIIEEMSRGSQFYIRQVEQSRKAEEKAIEMMAKLNAMDSRDILLAQRHAMDRVTDTEKRRSFTRVLAVLDMDMFFAAVEIRDQPHLKDVPVAVGGPSMISTTNYVARKYGVRSAMPGFIGKKLCPSLVFVAHNFEKYEIKIMAAVAAAVVVIITAVIIAVRTAVIIIVVLAVVIAVLTMLVPLRKVVATEVRVP